MKPCKTTDLVSVKDKGLNFRLSLGYVILGNQPQGKHKVDKFQRTDRIY